MDVFDYHIKDDSNWLTATQIYVLHPFARLAVSGGRGVEMTEMPYELKLKAATVNRIVKLSVVTRSLKKR